MYQLRLTMCQHQILRHSLSRKIHKRPGTTQRISQIRTHMRRTPRRMRRMGHYQLRLHPKWIHFMFTPRKTVRATYTLTPSIEVTIVELIVAPTRKITRFIEATTEAATLPPRKRF
ncbi:hypothetical protein Tco_1288240 [Tanacetum coccineum]